MQTKDHLALGRYLARVFEIEEPVEKYAFVIGNIMPDVDKCSYIHGYFQLLRAYRQQKDAGPLSLNDHRRMLIGGHTAEGSRLLTFPVTKTGCTACCGNGRSFRCMIITGWGRRHIIWRIASRIRTQCAIPVDFLRISDTKSSCISICGICLQSCPICGKR